MDTLKYINDQNKTHIYNDNVIYLKDLNKSIEKISVIIPLYKIK